MIAFIFPGQGSQNRGMGQSYFDEVREYASVEKEVDALLGYSMRQLCLQDTENRLRQTQYTQPSLYVVNALHYYKAVGAGEQPSYLAGHSLGEYNALLAAGAFDFLTGLRMVKKRGELMAQARNGSMAAVIGLDGERIAQILRDNDLSSIDVANYNSPSQVVISGSVEDIERAGPIFDNAGAALFLPLPVSAAFHSRYVAAAATAFGEFLAPLAFAELHTPVVANATGQPYPPQDSSSEGIKTLLVRQITQPVLWMQSVRYLIGQGVSQFKEIGPGNVLTRLVQQIRQPRGA